jgi:DNA-binding PadR family transcriptional regulator
MPVWSHSQERNLVRSMRRDTRVFEVLFLYFMSVMKADRIYGYELGARLKELTNGHEPPSYGVIYPFLRRMERAQALRSKRDESSGRVYYELTRKGKLTIQELPKKLKEAQEDLDELLLAQLTIYSKLYGRKVLNDLLRRIG